MNRRLTASLLYSSLNAYRCPHILKDVKGYVDFDFTTVFLRFLRRCLFTILILTFIFTYKSRQKTELLTSVYRSKRKKLIAVMPKSSYNLFLSSDAVFIRSSAYFSIMSSVKRKDGPEALIAPFRLPLLSSIRYRYGNLKRRFRAPCYQWNNLVFLLFCDFPFSFSSLVGNCSVCKSLYIGFEHNAF